MTPPTLVLAYHSVHPTWRHPLSVTPEAFRSQLTRLQARGYDAVTLEAVVGSAPRPRVAITFDDAFASVVEWAFPVLEDIGWQATIFVPTGAVDAGARLTWLADEAAGVEFEPVSWAQIGDLRRAGWLVGSHSVSHRRLSLLSDDELDEELGASRDRIVAEVGECSAISYPWGELDDRVVERAVAAGYELGSGLVGRFFPGDPMRLPRFPISSADGPLRLWFKTSSFGTYARSSRAWPVLEGARATVQRRAAAARQRRGDR